MKKIIFLTLLAGLFFVTACEKDESRAVLLDNPNGAIINTPEANENWVLTVADSAEYIHFAWDKADFGFTSAAGYLLELDKVTGDFSEPITVLSTVADHDSIMLYDFNNKLYSNGYPAAQPASCKIRVRAIVKGIDGSTVADTVYSEPVNITITPFKVIIIYPKLYVPGDHNGWNAADATSVISSVKSNNKYEGYLYFTANPSKFKLLKVPAWEEANTIGDPDASGTSGNLQIGSWGGNNIVASGGPGYFKINADLNEAKYTILKTDWGLIGSATPGGWDNDTNMTYNTETKVWTVTLNLTAGKIKFRANDGWDLNYGDTDANGSLDAGGTDINVAVAGNYTVTMDLSQPVYTYSVVKN